MQRSGFPNLTIHMYENYSAWLENRFIELTPALITATMRDGLISGVTEGLIQIYDDKNLHTLITGNELIRVVVGNSNTNKTLSRIYGVSNSSVVVDEKNDSVITLQVSSLHDISDVNYCRPLSNNASDSVSSMIDAFYSQTSLIKPSVTAVNIRVPASQWSGSISEYLKYISKYGVSVQNESFALVYECFDGIHLTDYATMMSQEPKDFVLVDPDIVGEMGAYGEYPIAFDFAWLTKVNTKSKQPHENVTRYTHSFIDNTLRYTVTGDGNNISLGLRSGAYEQQVDKNGVQETTRISTLTKNECYAKVTIYGDFDIMPTHCIKIIDAKSQMPLYFYVDEVIHEMSRERSVTTLYLFNYNKERT